MFQKTKHSICFAPIKFVQKAATVLHIICHEGSAAGADGTKQLQVFSLSFPWSVYFIQVRVSAYLLLNEYLTASQSDAQKT